MQVCTVFILTCVDCFSAAAVCTHAIVCIGIHIGM
jgi:hypothetical protein